MDLKEFLIKNKNREQVDYKEVVDFDFSKLSDNDFYYYVTTNDDLLIYAKELNILSKGSLAREFCDYLIKSQRTKNAKLDLLIELDIDINLTVNNIFKLTYPKISKKYLNLDRYLVPELNPELIAPLMLSFLNNNNINLTLIIDYDKEYGFLSNTIKNELKDYPLFQGPSYPTLFLKVADEKASDFDDFFNYLIYNYNHQIDASIALSRAFQSNQTKKVKKLVEIFGVPLNKDINVTYIEDFDLDIVDFLYEKTDNAEELTIYLLKCLEQHLTYNEPGATAKDVFKFLIKAQDYLPNSMILSALK